MALIQNQIQDESLNELAEKIFDEYLYMQVDTGTTLPTVSAVELVNGGTQIGNTTALFNKERTSGSTYTKLTDNEMVVQFELASGEPYNQPMTLGSFGMMNQQTSGDGLKLTTALPVGFTKDNQLKAKVRFNVKVIRTSEVNT